MREQKIHQISRQDGRKAEPLQERSPQGKAPPAVLSMSSPCMEGHKKGCFWSLHSTWHLHCLRPLLPTKGTGKHQRPHFLPGGAPRAAALPRPSTARGTDGLLLLWHPIPPQHTEESRAISRCPLGRVTLTQVSPSSSEHIQLLGLEQGCPCGSAPALGLHPQRRLPPPSSCWALGETLPLQVIFPPAHFSFPVGNWDCHGYWPCC